MTATTHDHRRRPRHRHRHRHAHVRQPGDNGSISVFFAVATVALLMIVGFVVDGGTQLRALQQADTVAAEAARQAGQRIDAPTSIRGAVPRAAVAEATTAGNSYLIAAGYAGSVTIIDGTRITATATTTRPTLLLSLAGISTITVTGTADVELTRGLTTPQ